MFTMWWTGVDEGGSNYGARIPVLDRVTGAAFALGLVRMLINWKSRTSVLFLVWLPALMLGAVGLVNNGAGYYRLSMPLVFACAISAWGLTGVAERVFPAGLAKCLCVLAVVAAAYGNLSYYFGEYYRWRSTNNNSATYVIVATRVCRGKGTGTDFDLMEAPALSYLRQLAKLQCAGGEVPTRDSLAR